MITKIFFALAAMALCVAIHAGGVTSALRWARRRPDAGPHFWQWTWLFICLAAWMILLHLSEITGWALLYLFGHALGDLPSAWYFSAVTYTTTGYGDLVLPQEWRLVGGIEALTGILMCGWSTGFFFAVVSRMYEPRPSPAAAERR